LGTDKQEIRRLGVVGFDATRAKEYYRTSFLTSSLKFRWLNEKGARNLKNGTENLQFLEIFGVTSGVRKVPETGAASMSGADDGPPSMTTIFFSKGS
jgi:hypothetical protein